jgi:hypothetical protein
MLFAVLWASVVLSTTAVTRAEAASPQGPGSIGIQLLAATPLTDAGTPTGVYIVSALRSGTVLRRAINVINTTDSIQRVLVYPAAASMRDGEFSFAAGSGSNQLSEWTRVSKPFVELPPNTSTTEAVSIAVPLHSTSGERYAVVWAQVSSQPSPGNSVRLVSRVGIRIYLTVGSSGQVVPRFDVGKLVATRSRDGVPIVTETVLNIGVSTVAVHGSITLDDGPGGIGIGPEIVNPIVALPPGDVGQVTVDFDRGLPRGPWRAAMTLSVGTTSRKSVSEIMFPALNPSMPWWRSTSVETGLVALVAILMLVFAMRAVTRRVRGVKTRVPPSYAAVSPESDSCLSSHPPSALHRRSAMPALEAPPCSDGAL